MFALIDGLSTLRGLRLHTDDDLIDRFHRRYTPIIFALCTCLVSLHQYVGEPITCWCPAQFTQAYVYVGEPITCWCPAQFTQAYVDYTNTVCWVSNTYYVPMQTELPRQHEDRDIISYYQWVPIILLCQAWLFFTPCLLWRFLNRRVGVNLSAIVEAGQSVQKAIYAETREKTIRYMVLQMDSYLMRQHKMTRGAFGRCMQTLAHYCFICCGRLYGNYLTCTYLCIKVLYIVNAVAQIFILDVFLGFGNTFHFHGVQVLVRLIEGRDWGESVRFPRVTICDFQVRQQQNVHNYSVQCVLPINLFNEKIFLFIWFWLLGLIVATGASLIQWLARIIWLPAQAAYVKRQLRAMDSDKREPRALQAFTQHYLRRDGVFIVAIVAKNAGELVAAELIHGLWMNYGPDRRAAADGTYNDMVRRRRNVPPLSQLLI